MMQRHLPNVALVAVWWVCSPSRDAVGACSSSSRFRSSLADIAMCSFVKTEAFSRLGSSEALVVLLRALTCAVLVIKLSLFERREWPRPWLPIAVQSANIAYCWIETLWPLVRSLWSLANAPPDPPEEGAEALAAAQAVRRRERQARAAAEAAARLKSERPPPEQPRVPPLSELCLLGLAEALRSGGFSDECAGADELRACEVLPLPAHLLAPLFELARRRGLLQDRSLPLVLAPGGTRLRLSAAAAGEAERGAEGEPGAAEGDEPLPSARVVRGRGAPLPCALSDLGCELAGLRCPGLRELHLTDCLALTDNGVRLLASACGELRVLELRRCPALTCAALLEVAQRLALLAALHVGGCPEVSDSGVGAVASSCARLRSLDVSGCAVHDESLHLLAQVAHALLELNVSGCLQLSPDAIRDFAHGKRGLHALTLSRSLGCCSWFTDSLQRELPHLDLVVEPAQVPQSLRWHPLPFTEFY